MFRKIIVIFIFISVAFSAYAQHAHPASNENQDSKSDVENTSCPYLTQKPKGEILLSWVKTKGSENVMCYAISRDKGSSFKDTVEISASRNVAPHGENLPKIVCKADGEMIAIWGAKNSNLKNKYSGLIFYAQSFDNGRTWTKATPIVNNPKSFDLRYFDVGILANGEAAIVWLDNPNNPEKEGSVLYYASTKGKKGFKNEKPIGETACQCCRTDLLIDQKGNIHVAYREILNDSIRDMVHLISTDGGNSFSKAKRISEDNWKINGCPHTGPAMAANDKGLHFVWFTQGGETGVYYTKSPDNGERFNARQLLNTKAKHPQMASVKDGSIAIAWEEEVDHNALSNSQIMLQLIKSDGKRQSYKISEEKGNCSYPVILEAEEKKVMVAWVQESALKGASAQETNQPKSSKGNMIVFKSISLE